MTFRRDGKSAVFQKSVFLAFIVAICIPIIFKKLAWGKDTVDPKSPPCGVSASDGINPTPNPTTWPDRIENEWLYETGLFEVRYPESQDPHTAWGVFKTPNERSGLSKSLRWMCGYRYGAKIPINYHESNKKYPVVIFLHGGHTSHGYGENHWLSGEFYIPDDDPYIFVIPTKLEVDWSAKKILDVVEDLKLNMRVDEERVYLTGLSMGGRGTFIVASEIPDQFAALMPLSPHHEPYSYVDLAARVAHLPVWLSHGDADMISSYKMAWYMNQALEEEGCNVLFQTIKGGGHCCWEHIYSNPEAIEWLLSHTRNLDSETVIHLKSWGRLKSHRLSK